jgi:hypothetical protein
LTRGKLGANRHKIVGTAKPPLELFFWLLRIFSLYRTKVNLILRSEQEIYGVSAIGFRVCKDYANTVLRMRHEEYMPSFIPSALQNSGSKHYFIRISISTGCCYITLTLKKYRPERVKWVPRRLRRLTLRASRPRRNLVFSALQQYHGQALTAQQWSLTSSLFSFSFDLQHGGDPLSSSAHTSKDSFTIC